MQTEKRIGSSKAPGEIHLFPFGPLPSLARHTGPDFRLSNMVYWRALRVTQASSGMSSSARGFAGAPWLCVQPPPSSCSVSVAELACHASGLAAC